MQTQYKDKIHMNIYKHAGFIPYTVNFELISCHECGGKNNIYFQLINNDFNFEYSDDICARCLNEYIKNLQR